MSCHQHRPTVDHETDSVFRWTMLCIVLASALLWLMWNGSWVSHVAS